MVDGDLSNYFGEIPHAELIKSIARRVCSGSSRHGWRWVEEDDGKGGRRRTNRARRERKGTPQGAPISPLLSNLYMRRFTLGWKVLGYARRFCAEIVNYADDFRVLGKAPAAEMLTAVKRIMEVLKLAVNERKTRCLRCPEEPMEFLGYRIGRNYRPMGKGAYIAPDPARRARRSASGRRRGTGCCSAEMVEHLNRSGWANYFCLGQVSPAYHAIDRHAVKRLGSTR